MDLSKLFETLKRARDRLPAWARVAFIAFVCAALYSAGIPAPLVEWLRSMLAGG